MYDTKKKYVVLSLPNIDYEIHLKWKCKNNVKGKVKINKEIKRFTKTN